MPYEYDNPPVSSTTKPIGVDEAAGGVQQVKILDSTPGSTAGTGVPGHPLATREDPSASLSAGTITASTSAQVIGAARACPEVLVQNSRANTVMVLVGNATQQVIEIWPGESINLPVSDVSLVYVKTPSGTATVSWLARS